MLAHTKQNDRDIQTQVFKKLSATINLSRFFNQIMNSFLSHFSLSDLEKSDLMNLSLQIGLHLSSIVEINYC